MPLHVNEKQVSESLYCEKNYGENLIEQVTTYIDNIIGSLDGSDNADSFKWCYLRDSILSKYSPDDRVVNNSPQHLKALENHEFCESRCKEFNDNGLNGTNHVLAIARDLIRKAIGDTPDLCEVKKYCRYSNGASTQHKRPLCTPFNKVATEVVHVTPRCSKLFKLCYGDDVQLQFVHGNRVGFVPKNVKTARSTASEPTGNMFVQLGIGGLIRSLLLKVPTGYDKNVIDLRDQSQNQELARLGSINQLYCTIDGRMASALISQRLVLELLPMDWFLLLDAARSPYYDLNGTVRKWEQFSSMGNGFTFELETLIFWALTKATCIYVAGQHMRRKVVVSVYGDDIICESRFYESVTRELVACGFLVNEEKSFHTGPFRESCGSHFYNGFNVTPFYIRQPINNVQRHNWLLNRLRKWSYCNLMEVCDPRVWELWRSILKQHPLQRKLRGSGDIYNDNQIYAPGKPIHRLQLVSHNFPVDGKFALELSLLLKRNNVLFEGRELKLDVPESPYPVRYKTSDKDKENFFGNNYLMVDVMADGPPAFELIGPGDEAPITILFLEEIR